MYMVYIYFFCNIGFVAVCLNEEKKHIDQIRCVQFIYNSTFQLLYCDIIDSSILSPVATFINNSKLSLSKYYVRHY